METYCGKNCEICTWREPHQCPGCESGPGRLYGGDCDIARCCREKGHASCGTCLMTSTGCTKWSGRESAPAVRQDLMEIKAAREAEVAAQAPALGKWLWLAFWLIVPNAVVAIMTMDSVVEAVPGLQVPGYILEAVCGAAYAYILWQLKDIRDSYRTASTALLANAGLGLLVLLIPEGRVGLLLLASLPSLGLGLLADYNEFMGHAAVLEGVEEELSANWKKLWDWNVKLLLGILGSFLVVFILPVVGALALLAIAVGLLVIQILKLTYLYRMATLFRAWQ